MTMTKRNDLEHRALHLITNAGPGGILQRSLWKELTASSREGSRIALKLEKKGLIKRERELSEGRWTFRLNSRRRPMSIASIVDVPCTVCAEILKCGPGGPVTPTTCNNLTMWLSASANTGEKADSN